MIINKILLLLFLVEVVRNWCFFTYITEENKVSAVDYAPTGSVLATGSESEKINIYDAYTMSRTHQFTWSGKKPISLKFYEDASWIAAGYEDSTMKLFYMNGTIVDVSTSHSKVYDIDFNSDYTLMLTCGDDKKYRVWTVGTWGSPLHISNQLGDVVYSCKFTSDNAVVVGLANGQANVYSPYSSTTATTSYSGSKVWSLDVKWGTHQFTRGCDDKKVYYGATGTSTQILSSSGKFFTVSYSRTNQFILAAGQDDNVYFINGSSHELAQTFTEPSGNILDSSFSVDGYYSIVGSEDFSAYIYKRNCIQCLNGQYYDTNTLSCLKCQDVLDACAQCNNDTLCEECVQGFFLNVTTLQCQPCHWALPGCGLCWSGQACAFCISGYYVNSTDNICKSCQTAIPGCLSCNSDTQCLVCHSQYYLDSSTDKCLICSTNLPNCLECSDVNTCIECEMGYQEITGSCQRCPANCLSCLDNYCYDCSLSYYPEAGSCVRCSGDCLACNSTDYCFDCPADMYWDNGVCIACSFPCLTCSNDSSCLLCYPGFYYDGADCILCQQGCTTCNQTDVCFSCLSGYYHDSVNLQCINCFDTYSHCSICDETDCLNCIYGYYPDLSGKCLACGTLHACLSCNSSDSCLVCAQGHYQLNGGCQTCPLGCQTCESGTECTNCVPGFYLDGVDCLPCTSNCVTCSDSSTCQSCEIGLYLLNTTCEPCGDIITDCIACIQAADSNIVCVDCSLDTYLDSSGYCQPCFAHCLYCQSDINCNQCENRYFLDSGNSSCTECEPQCLSCTGIGQCDLCQIGYYSNQGQCDPCSTIGCLVCNNTMDCLQCIVGYYLTADYECRLCNSQIRQCLRCDSQNYCQACNFGYILASDNSSCVACSENIVGCIDCLDETTCIKCEPTYYQNGASCESCPIGCFDCENGTFCLSCQSMYYYDNLTGTCSLCEIDILGCQICADNNTCQNCLSGYYLDNQMCSLCSSQLIGCTICNDSNTCIQCSEGYYLKAADHKCHKCSVIEGCSICLDQNYCLDCQSGYFYDGAGHCLLCSGTLPGCQFCNSTDTCASCLSGFYLTDADQCDLCSNQIPGCIFCGNQTTCLQCEGGYYLDSVNSVCEPCANRGCEFCDEDNSTYCLSCNSQYYMQSPGFCQYCRSVIPGCIACSNDTYCDHCDSGYYENGASCDLCSLAMEGCSICESNTQCLDCKAMYYLDTDTQCKKCSTQLTGCAFCKDKDTCLTCQSGYYLDGATCSPCNTIQGCIFCQDASNCLICQTSYYFSSYSCLQCSVIEGCFSCISDSVCTSCLGGYQLDGEGGCEPVDYSAAAIPQNQDIMLKTMYVDKDTLKHNLYLVNLKYDLSADLSSISWIDQVQLSLTLDDGSNLPLVIKSVQWGDNDYTLTFLTDNPLNFTEKDIQVMPFARRMLQSSINTQATTSIVMSESAMDQVMPDYAHTGPLVVDYSLNDPEFYASYIQQINNSPYFIIGIIITVILFIKYSIKALLTVPKSQNLGQIIPHILALKAGALILYPTYLEYVNYCSGFMAADIPWLNTQLGSVFGKKTDTTPYSYSIFYVNMNMGSTYFLAFCTIIVLCLIVLGVSKCTNSTQKMYSYYQFLYSFFCFGVAFAGCVALQGAILNPIESLTLNGFFYILGIILYLSVVVECFYRLKTNHEQYFWRLRVLFKATILSLSHFSPIYLLATAICLDAILIVVQYRLCLYARLYKIPWIIANVLANLATILIIFVPAVIVSLVTVTLFTVGAIVAQAYIHYLETKMPESVQQKSNGQMNATQQNIWQLNFQKNENNVSKQLQKDEKDDKLNTIYMGDYPQNQFVPIKKKRTKHRGQNRKQQKDPSIIKVKPTNNKKPATSDDFQESFSYNEEQLDTFNF